MFLILYFLQVKWGDWYIMNKWKRPSFISPAAEERRQLTVPRSRMGSDILSPSSQETTPCTSRMVDNLINPSVHQQTSRGSTPLSSVPRSMGGRNAGSIQAKASPHPGRQGLNTSLPHYRRLMSNSTLSPLSANVYHGHNLSCPVKGKSSLIH